MIPIIYLHLYKYCAKFIWLIRAFRPHPSPIPCRLFPRLLLDKIDIFLASPKVVVAAETVAEENECNDQVAVDQRIPESIEILCQDTEEGRDQGLNQARCEAVDTHDVGVLLAIDCVLHHGYGRREIRPRYEDAQRGEGDGEPEVLSQGAGQNCQRNSGPRPYRANQCLYHRKLLLVPLAQQSAHYHRRKAQYGQG